MTITIEIYTTKRGKKPVASWINSIRDKNIKAKIKLRLNRIELNNFGDHKYIDSKLRELRLHFGPGYRIYFVSIASSKILLLYGGNKKTQKRDICIAKRYYLDYLERKND